MIDFNMYHTSHYPTEEPELTLS